jgi:hypothetical protein
VFQFLEQCKLEDNLPINTMSPIFINLGQNTSFVTDARPPGCSSSPVQERHIVFWPHKWRTFSNQSLLSSVECTVLWWVFLWCASDIHQWRISALANICSWMNFAACSNSCLTFFKWSVFSVSSLLTKWMCWSSNWNLHRDSRNNFFDLHFLFVNYPHCQN